VRAHLVGIEVFVRMERVVVESTSRPTVVIDPNETACERLE